jgi:hypothetical protein
MNISEMSKPLLNFKPNKKTGNQPGFLLKIIYCIYKEDTPIMKRKPTPLDIDKDRP